MTEGEKVHNLTEDIYKNILDNFNPGVKQLITNGRNLAKALHHVTTAAKSYIECVYNIAKGAQVGKGVTSEIGAALLQIAEVQKEINTQVIDNVKSFHAELLIPIDTRQETEAKQILANHKKYLAGHKYHLNPLHKASTALKKHKKKAKASKYGYDEKEMQYAREVQERQAKLDEFRVHGLRQALGEERRRYTFVLDRVCAMVRNYASHHSKAHELLTHRLSEWTDLTRDSHPDNDTLIRQFRGLLNPSHNAQPQPQPNEILYREPMAEYMQKEAMFREHVETPTRASMDVRDPPHRPQVQALYAHDSAADSQLSFIEGDVIALIGDKRDGWQYGENIRSHRMGWFPLAFTLPIERRVRTRARSIGNLQDLAQFDRRTERSNTISQDQSSPLHSEQRLRRQRPASMYAMSSHTMPATISDAMFVKDERTVTWAAGLSHVAGDRSYPGSPSKVQLPNNLQELTDIYGVIHRAPAPPGNMPPPPPPTPFRSSSVQRSGRHGSPIHHTAMPPLPPRSLSQLIPEELGQAEESVNPEGVYDTRGHALSEPAYMSRRELQGIMADAAMPASPSPPSSSGYSGSNPQQQQQQQQQQNYPPTQQGQQQQQLQHISNPIYANHAHLSTPASLDTNRQTTSAPGFPPPPPPLAAPTPPSTTSDYEEEPPIVRYGPPPKKRHYVPM